jgi:hypothetical protein
LLLCFIIHKIMIIHMKTTLIIPDELMRELKREATDRGETLSNIVTDTLQKGLGRRRIPRKAFKIRTYRCGKVFLNVADRDQLYRAMEGK